MMITRPMIDRDQVTPLLDPKIGERRSWIFIITQETTIYKGFRMLSIYSYLFFLLVY